MIGRMKRAPANIARRGFLECSVEPIKRGVHKDDERDKHKDDPDAYRFVAATEGGVRTFFGPEHLDMDGGNFERYRSNPIVLDSHDRFSSGAVIGRRRRPRLRVPRAASNEVAARTTEAKLRPESELRRASRASIL